MVPTKIVMYGVGVLLLLLGREIYYSLAITYGALRIRV